MNERWKPELGEQYWIVVFNEVGLSTWREDREDLSRWQMGNCFRTREEAEAASEKVKALLLNLHEPTKDCNQLPKLTAEVFDRPDCPEWAKYAVVDVQGLAYWYQYLPLADERIGYWKTLKNKRQLIDGFFDRSNWQNSLIKRPDKLPDWCKVGEYGYAYDSGYFKIVEIIDWGHNLKVEWIKEGVQGTVFGCNIKCKKQARLRPWTFEDAPLSLKVKDRNGIKCLANMNGLGSHYLINIVGNGSGPVETFAEFAKKYTRIDNTPCGVLEHLDEKGEWVE